MIHHNPDPTAATPVADWRETVAIGDIIRWPLGSDDESLALVVDIETIGGWHVLTVAPGVADVSQPVRPGTLRLTRLDEVRDSGLMQPIRFVLDRRISIAPNHPGLDNGTSPVVGHLCERALERLQAERARIHALRDIAADRRQQCRTARQDRRTGWRPQPRPMTVAKEDRA